jgi:hypothetical protein
MWEHDEAAVGAGVRGESTEVGHQAGACTVTSVQRNEAQCNATYSLRGGQITAQTVISLGNPAPYAVPITGGSGKYQGAEGEVLVQPAVIVSMTSANRRSFR